MVSKISLADFIKDNVFELDAYLSQLLKVEKSNHKITPSKWKFKVLK